MNLRLVYLLLLLVGLAGCLGEEDDDDDDGGSAEIAFSIQPVLSGGTTGTANSLGRALNITPRNGAESCDAVANYPAYSAIWGASGAPEEMTLYLKSIVLSSSNSGTTTTLYESASAAGDAITISNDNGGEVDMSVLAAALDSADEGEVDEEGAIETEITTGSFNRLSITFANGADIKGCIQESWEATPQGTNGRECDAAGGDACDTLVAGDYRVCTKANKGVFNLVGESGNVTSTATFDDFVLATGDAEATQVNLLLRDSTDGFDQSADATFNIDVPELTVDEGDEIALTLAFDLNLLLRFEGNTRVDNGTDNHPLRGMMQSAGGDGEFDSAYFHTTYLPDVMAVYLGAPGDVHGYDVKSCYAFDGDQNDLRAVDSWMTVIFDTAGDVVTGFVTPKDDAGFVLLKGNINPTDATTRPSVKNTDGTYDLKFGEQTYSGALNTWEPQDALGDSATLGTDKVEQTRTSATGTSQQSTWHYERKL